MVDLVLARSIIPKDAVLSTSICQVKPFEGGEWLLLNHLSAFPRLEIIRVDQGYKESFCQWVAQTTTWTVEVIAKPADQEGFAVIPKRWVVERTFAWLGRYRQLSKEYDRRPESTEGWIYLASIDMLLKRLHPRL